MVGVGMRWSVLACGGLLRACLLVGVVCFGMSWVVAVGIGLCWCVWCVMACGFCGCYVLGVRGLCWCVGDVVTCVGLCRIVPFVLAWCGLFGLHSLVCCGLTCCGIIRGALVCVRLPRFLLWLCDGLLWLDLVHLSYVGLLRFVRV